tara:strand:+ start:4816 stop:5088 length:273 start_codon:yes stop_codon:yes gene_type:complete
MAREIRFPNLVALANEFVKFHWGYTPGERETHVALLKANSVEALTNAEARASDPAHRADIVRLGIPVDVVVGKPLAAMGQWMENGHGIAA